MKKIALMIAGLAASGAASAVTFESSDLLRMTDCPNLLNENVRINLSSGVRAGVTCTATAIAVGTCHTAGRTTSREVEQLVPSETDPDVLVPQDPPVYATVEGPAVATASTIQGTVVSLYPEADACTSSVAEGQATARLSQ